MPSPQDFLRARMLDIIREYEGFRPDAYKVKGENFYTIGYGNTYNEDGSRIRPDQRVTREQADGMMQRKADEYYKKLMTIPAFAALPEATRRSLGSFSYNTGPNWYGNPDFTTLTSAVDSGDTKRIGDAIGLYINPGSEVEEGLRRRRVAERELIITGGIPQAPTKPKPGTFTISPKYRKRTDRTAGLTKGR